MNNGIKKQNGDKLESKISDILNNLSLDYTRDVRADNEIGFINATDFLVEDALWIHATCDLYNGTLQIDRLEHAYQMFIAGLWQTGKVMYVVERIELPPVKVKTPTARQLKMREAYQLLLDNSIVVSVNDLEALLQEKFNVTNTKNEQAGAGPSMDPCEFS